MVLALASGALRRYLGRRCGLPARLLVAAGMPVSLRCGRRRLHDAGDDGAGQPRDRRRRSGARGWRRLRVRLCRQPLTTRARSVIPTDFLTLGAPSVARRGSRARTGARSTSAVAPPLANLG
ncbi:MAG: hypothetical protein IPI27_18395 [Betaproteobacteria bacterium]|nr:hypothetical protein [Betaproteobacteria bacterium]